MPTAMAHVHAGAGHAPHWEDPERVANEIAAFVAALEPRLEEVVTVGHLEFAELGAPDVPEAERLLDRVIAGRVQLRLGEPVDVLALPCRVARVDGRLIGVAAYAPGHDRRGELAALAVAPEQRGRRIGVRLLTEAVEAMQRAGCDEVWLVTTNDNLTALRLTSGTGSA